MKLISSLAALGLLLAAPAAPAVAQEAMPPSADDGQALAKQLANPISALISVPAQSNYDWGMGPSGNGHQYRLNIQPVIPIDLNKDWTLISRTILPVIDQNHVAPTNDRQTGLGDVVQSLFFSPKAPTGSGWIWGAGPAALIPTATDRFLGTEKWGIGPTAVVLKQNGPWTVGLLVNHIWSVAGSSHRDEVNASFVQPFLGYTTTSAMTFLINTESTYDWTHRQWTAPLNLTVAQLLKPKTTGLSFPLQVQIGYRFYVEKPSGGPDAGLRLSIVALFPR